MRGKIFKVAVHSSQLIADYGHRNANVKLKLFSELLSRSCMHFL